VISWYLERYHRGKDNAIGGHALAKRMEFGNIREVQAQVEHERQNGHPICSAPGIGYWYPSSLEDADHCIAWLKDMGLKHMRDARLIEDALAEDGQAVLFGEG